MPRQPRLQRTTSCTATNWRLATGDWSRLQNVDPTANRNLNRFSGLRLLSSTPARDGFIAKISRNGTFSTGMKKRISAPVDVLNAFVCADASASRSAADAQSADSAAADQVQERRHRACPAARAR